jgi:CelD/BcsL family acetyltransferase involved in cellulose biosynthesis
MASIRRSIESGYRGYDFMRGDEPYKAHFRATARPSMEIRVIPDRAGPQIRHQLWLTGSRVKRWLKTSLKTS